jgi:hypothetical protein
VAEINLGPVSLAELRLDVALAAPATGDVFARGAAGKWVNVVPPAGGGLLQSPAAGQVPVFSDVVPRQLRSSFVGSIVNDTTQDALQHRPSGALSANLRPLAIYAAAADTLPHFYIDKDAKLQFGAPNSAADASLYRESSSGVRLRTSQGLRVDGKLSAGGPMVSTGATTVTIGGAGQDYGQLVLMDTTQTGTTAVVGMEFLDQLGDRYSAIGKFNSATQTLLLAGREGIDYTTGISTGHAHGTASLVRGHTDDQGKWFIGTNVRTIASRKARLALWNNNYTTQSIVDGSVTSNSAGDWDILLLRGATDQGLPSGGAFIRVENSSNNRILELTAGGIWQWYNPSTDVAEGQFLRDAANSLKWTKRLVVSGQVLGDGTGLSAGQRGLDVKGNVTAAYNATAANDGQWRVQAPNATSGAHCGITYEDSAGNRVGWAGMVMLASAHDMVWQGFDGSAYNEWARLTRTGSLSLPKSGAKILTAGGLGVGNSSIATAVGPLARVVQVFANDGTTSLGYCPLYSSFS